MRLMLLAPLLLSACTEADSASLNASHGYDLESRVDALDAQVLALEAQNAQQLAQQEQTIALLSNKVSRLETGLTMTCNMRASTQIPQARAQETSGRSPAVPTWAGAFLTDAVVRVAIQDVLAYDVDFYSVSYSARDQAFQAVAEQGGYEMHHNTYSHWRGRILDVARQHLSDPVRLQAVWQQHKPAVLEEIAQGEREIEVRRALTEVVLPAFDLEITSPIRAAYTEQAFAWDALGAFEYNDVCHSVMVDRHQAAVTLLDAITELPDVDILQWRLRREAEGGPALVKAWRQIFDDLADALDRPTPQEPD